MSEGFGAELTGDWEKAAKAFEGMEGRFKKALAAATLEEGEFLKAKLIEELETASFPPLSPMTLLFRGGEGGRPLAGLVKNVVVKKVGDAVFVGISAAGGSRGMDRAAIAELQESGSSHQITTTDRQRRFIMATLREAGVLAARDPHPGPGGPMLITITIPPRPFVQPTLDKHAKPEDVKRRFYRSIARLMRGDLGLA